MHGYSDSDRTVEVLMYIMHIVLLISGIVYAMRIFMSLIVLCFTLALIDMNDIL